MFKIDDIKPISKVLLVLVSIQAVRMLIVYIFHNNFGFSTINNQLMNSALYIIIGLALVKIFRADKNNLALIIRTKKTGYIIAGAVLLALIIFNPAVLFNSSAEEIVSLFYSVLIIPIFEELIFRGYTWDYLDKKFNNEFKTYIYITILFAIWHLGYVDSIIYRVNIFNYGANIAYIMLNKVIIGLVFGVATGFARFKLKNTYASFLVHSTMNMFGK